MVRSNSQQVFMQMKQKSRDSKMKQLLLKQPSANYQQYTLNDNASSNKKNPARPEERKFVAKFVTVACRDERALRLFTQHPHIVTLKNMTRLNLTNCLEMNENKLDINTCEYGYAQMHTLYIYIGVLENTCSSISHICSCCSLHVY